MYSIQKHAKSILVLGMLIFLVAGPVFAGGSQEKSEDVSILRIAMLMDEANPASGIMNDEFAAALSAELGIQVEASILMEYAVGVEAMRAGRLDIMFASPMMYYQAQQRANVEPLVTTGSFGGVPYHSIFITRADRDDINSLEDLRGKDFAFVDPGSASGYVYPKVTLVQELGLDPQRIENPRYYFETVTYSGQHQASIMGVLMGDYDASVVALALLPMMENAGVLDPSDLKIIAETPSIPSPLHIIRSDLPAELKEQIRNFYLSYDREEYFEAVYSSSDLRYVRVDDSDYDVIRAIVEDLGITQE